MIKETELIVSITNRNKKYFINLGYDINSNTRELLVPIKDVARNSHQKVTAICSLCNKEQTLMYYKYLQNTERHGFYSCKSCSNKKKVMTSNEKYGADNYMMTEEGKNRVMRTTMERYGTHCVFLNKDVRDRIKNTMIETYGAPYTFNTSKYKKDLLETWKKERTELLNKLGIFDFKLNTSDYSIDIYCDNCKQYYKTDNRLLYARNMHNTILCTICNPRSRLVSGKELILYNEICKISDNVISGYKFSGGKEIDIYLPDYKLGIEFNGLYWHSEKYKPKDYHINKTRQCEEHGITLIHVWEDELDKMDILVNYIRSKIVKFHSVGARKCRLQMVSHKEAKDFVNKYHLQGWAISKYNIGLYYDDELIQIGTFSKTRKIYGGTDESYELVRFCTKFQTTVIGGLSKIIKEFVRISGCEKLLTYADASKSSGYVYRQCGFEQLQSSKPGYWYVLNDKRIHRFSLRKSVLVDMGGDPEKTEYQLATELGYYRVYDCGQHKFVLNI